MKTNNVSVDDFEQTVCDKPWGINGLPYSEYVAIKKTVIVLLEYMGVDGETMQEILEEVGMDEQMHSQLNVTFGENE